MDTDNLSPPQEQDGGSKRKADNDGAHPQQRAKRNRYISIACNECKRRKIKCNGESICQRCGNLNLECVYAPNCCNGFKDSVEFRDMASNIASLQDQVNAFFHELNALRAQLNNPAQDVNQLHQASTLDPSLHSPFPVPHAAAFAQQQTGSDAQLTSMASASPGPRRGKRHSRSESQPSFRGPTSSDFNFGVARHSLQTMGITSQEEAARGNSGNSDQIIRDASPMETNPLITSRPPPMWHTGDTPSKDPIWFVSQEEALRLCRVWEDEMGMMYPVLDIEKVIAYVQKLYRFMEAAQRNGLMLFGAPGVDSMDDEDTNILKMVLATAMTVEGSGRSEMGQRLFEHVHSAIDQLLLGDVDTKGIRLLVLTAMYEFQRDNEGTSWRIIGVTTRLCIELGLHRRETYEAISDDSERTETMLLFWAIYVLDRRWSFGTGMPFALQDQDIDPSLPRPEDQSPYLSAMIQYSAIGTKVWRSVIAIASPNADRSINTEEMGYLDYQIIQWLRNIPAHLRFEHPSKSERLSTPIGPPPSRAASRLRILLYIRANQMRILILRPVLHSATSIMQHREEAQTVVDVAKDTIRVLTHINQTSDLYRTQQVLFNAFLTSALAVLFLAVAHTPAEFAEAVREEFYMALDLVRGFSKGSWVSKRLWKTVRGLKELGPQLGLANASAGVEMENGTAKARGNAALSHGVLDPNRSAAVAMAGLAGHNVDEMALFQTQAQAWPGGVSGTSSSPEGMANDLTSLFEAAGGYLGVNSNGSNDNGGGDAGFGRERDGAAEGLEGLSARYEGDEDGLSAILKELF